MKTTLHSVEARLSQVSAYNGKPAHIEVRKMTAAEKKSDATVLGNTLAVIVDRTPQGISGDNYVALYINAEEAGRISHDLAKLAGRTANLKAKGQT